MRQARRRPAELHRRLVDIQVPWTLLVILGLALPRSRASAPWWLAGRFALGAMEALDRGCRDELIAWQPFGGVGEATAEPRVRRVPLALALAETARLLDGTSEVTRRRVLMMQRLESVLSL